MITVVGIGADGWDGISTASRLAISAAEVLVGSPRQLDLIPPTPAERLPLPSPLLPALPELLTAHEDQEVCVLASGDPMFFGIGATLARLLGPGALRVLPHVSSLSLACARLGWPVERVTPISLLGRPLAAVTATLQPGARVLVLSPDGGTPAEVAALLTGRGYGASTLTVLSDLGTPAETRVSGTAATWAHPATAPLNVIAVECAPAGGTRPLPRTPGLPDDAFDHDGQITKREVRAVTLSRLAPMPGELLWDVGAGAGSVAIEWMRTHPTCAAIAVESHPARATRIRRNAEILGVPTLRLIESHAPEALAGLPAPDAVFVGGGTTTPGVLETSWHALRPGGRLVVNAVTLESEAVVTRWHAAHGGDLTRLSVHRASPIGGFTGWRAMMPVTIWATTKEDMS
ncbi:precorrin-6y C5,15-methyltransferase (decarboxylating) subunit CbiE [Sphaerisporangium aureirubrum]|uniref:Precorrin-6y C5,15-methyltransferase (Decarboxylating) subunit CbiE n=1 Tax=Sphaerisporangium aureirubrum TaxID=1544736 RepID=A0ABW1NGB6_9ACTN